MSLVRWEPFREMLTLRQAVDQLFDESIIRPLSPVSGIVTPAFDILEDEEAYRVQAGLPGIAPEQVEISLLGTTLRITGEIAPVTPPEGSRWLVRERRQGRFDRVFTLPTAVNGEAVTATVEHGLLTITLPKAASARPRQIKVAVSAPAA